MKKGSFFPQLFAVVALAMATAPAFASSCNGITQQVAGLIQLEIAHTVYHTEMLWLAISTGNLSLLAQMTACATNGLTSVLLFNPAGWAFDYAMFLAIPIAWKRLSIMHTMFARLRFVRN